MKALNNFSQIVVDSPVNAIIRQIKDSISSGVLKPGDRLPSERQLSERLGVGRTHLRDAIRKMEFYGILKTMPQSGTFVSGLGITALEGLISDMLDLQGNDFKSLIETRVILETNLAQLAAINRTDKDIKEIEAALHAHKLKTESDEYSVEEDLLFHLKIADASKNSVLKSLMLIISPDIMHYFKKHDVCGEGRSNRAVDEHERLLQHIIERDADKAGEAIQLHLDSITKYSKTLKEGMVLNDNGSLTLLDGGVDLQES